MLASALLLGFPLPASADDATVANQSVDFVVPGIDRAFGGYSDQIVWRTLDGSSSGQVALDDNISAMTVDTDGTRIYVRLQSGEVQVFDSVTLEQEASLPIAETFYSMVATNGVVTASTCNWWETGTTIHQFDIADPDNLRSSWTPQQECPPMFVDPSDPDVVFLGARYPWETVTKVDISTSTATELAQLEATNVGQGTMTPAGDKLFFVANGGVVELDPGDLSVVDTYDPPGTDYISDVEATSDGDHLVAATGTAAYSFARGGGPDPVATWPYRVDRFVGSDASDVYGRDWGMLLRLDDVDQARNTAAISVQAPAGPAADGDAVTFNGSLTANGLDPTQASVRLFRWGPEGEDGYSLTELGSGTPDGDGDFSIEATIVDQPDPTSNYLVYWEGDADHTSALSRTMFTSSKRLSSITVNASLTTHAAMQPVTATGQLTFDDGADASGRTVILSYGQEPVELTTGPNGTFSHTYQRGAGNESNYDLEATFEATPRYSRSTAEQYMITYKVPAPLSISVSPNPATYDGTATVTAHLDEWMGDGHIEIFEHPLSGGDWTPVDEGDVDEDGDFSIEVDTFTNRYYQAVYEGDQQFQGAEDEEELEVEVQLKEKMSRYKRKQGGVYLYNPNGTAVYVVHVVAPDLKGGEMSMILQSKAGHGWRTKVFEDFRIPESNTVGVAIPMRYLRSNTYRIYAITLGTSEYGSTQSEPAVFRKL